MERITRLVWKVGMMDRFGYTAFHAIFDFALLVALLATLLHFLI